MTSESRIKHKSDNKHQDRKTAKKSKAMTGKQKGPAGGKEMEEQTRKGQGILRGFPKEQITHKIMFEIYNLRNPSTNKRVTRLLMGRLIGNLQRLILMYILGK